MGKSVEDPQESSSLFPGTIRTRLFEILHDTMIIFRPGSLPHIKECSEVLIELATLRSRW
jgi:hypothetical protein